MIFLSLSNAYTYRGKKKKKSMNYLDAIKDQVFR